LNLPDLTSLSLAEQVAQMAVARASGYLFDRQIQYPAWEPPAATLQHWLQDLGIGGVILLGGSAAELALRSHQLQSWAKYPLLIAADIEEGVGQRFAGATWFPPPMALGAIAQHDLERAKDYARQMGAATAQEALAIGINWILAPVVDVNNNPHNPVINVRAFGDTPEIVSELARAFIDGTRTHPVLTTAKHFPGHGDTATDSHLELPVVPHSAERLAAVELLPFQSAIASGVDAVMSAHLAIPAWDEERPATLSSQVLTKRLRGDLGFEGLVVTDALIMGAIANRYGADEAPVLAVEAGADIILMPMHPEGAIRAVCDAVAKGRLSRERIQASVTRIWQAKARVSRDIASQGDSPGLNWLHHLAQPTAFTAASEILRQSQRTGGALPLSPEPTPTRRQRNLIVVDDVLSSDVLGRHAPAVTFPRQCGYTLQLVDRHTPPTHEDSAEESELLPTLLQLFIRGNPFRGSAGLSAFAENWFKTLLRTGNLQALVLYGSPYSLEQFLTKLPNNVPYVYSYGQMPQAQAIALETLFGRRLDASVPTAFL
jgi:beta-glucosidase